MFYNNGMDGLDIIDQKAPAYRIDGKTKHFLEHFFLSHGCHACKQSYCLHDTW